MNSCEQYQELISRLVDGEISRDEREALMEHMNSCSRCNAMYAVFLDLSDLLSQEEKPLPEGLHENIMAGVRRSAVIKKNRRLRRFGLSTALSAAACAVLVLFAATGFNPSKRAESVSVRGQEAAVQLAPAPAADTAPVNSAAEYAQYAAPAPAAMPAPVQTPAPVSDAYYVPENTYTAPQPENYEYYSNWQQPEVSWTQPEAPVQSYPEASDAGQPLVFSDNASFDSAAPVENEVPAAPQPAEESAGPAMFRTEAARKAESADAAYELQSFGPADAETQAVPELSASLYAAPAEEAGGENEEPTAFFSLFSSSDNASFDSAAPDAPEEEGDAGMDAPIGEFAALGGAAASEPAEIFTALTAAEDAPESAAETPAPSTAPVKEEQVDIYGKDARLKLLALIGSRQATMLPAEAELTRVVHVSLLPEDSYGSEEKMDINIYGDFIFCRYYPVGGEEQTWYAECSLVNLDSFLDACRAAAQPSPSPTADPYVALTPIPSAEASVPENGRIE